MIAIKQQNQENPAPPRPLELGVSLGSETYYLSSWYHKQYDSKTRKIQGKDYNLVPPCQQDNKNEEKSNQVTTIFIAAAATIIVKIKQYKTIHT